MSESEPGYVYFNQYTGHIYTQILKTKFLDLLIRLFFFFLSFLLLLNGWPSRTKYMASEILDLIVSNDMF